MPDSIRHRRRRTRCGRSTAHMLMLLGAATLGCGRVERVRQCQALVATVNPALDGIEARQRVSGTSRAALRELAERYRRLSRDIRALPFSDPEMVQATTEYVSVLNRIASATSGVADSLGRADVLRMAKLRVELESLDRKHKTLARRIDRVCLER